MNKCRCGCGQEVEEGKQFLKGHWSKFNAQKKAEEPKQGAQKPEEPKQAEPLKITFGDFRQILLRSENVAWFKTAEGYISKELEFYCTLLHENKNEQCDYVAVVLEDGSIMPAVLLPGFAGVYSRHEEPKEPEKEEIKPEQLEIMDGKPLPPEENPAISQPDEPKDDGLGELRKLLESKPTEKKKSFIARMLGGDATKEQINASGYAGK